MADPIALINPDHLGTNVTLLGRMQPSAFRHKEFFFCQLARHFVVYRQKLHKNLRTGQQKWLIDQTELPLRAVEWIPWVIEEKFFKSPAEGGLPKGRISYREVVDGEKLFMMRASGALLGYEVVNLDRGSHIAENPSLPTFAQRFQMPDDWLFNEGLMDFLKDLGGRYQRGEL